jgi:hypothetical protein
LGGLSFLLLYSYGEDVSFNCTVHCLIVFVVHTIRYFFFFFWHNEEYTRSELTLSCIAQTLPLVRLSGSKQCVEQAVASHLNMTITQGKETQ